MKVESEPGIQMDYEAVVQLLNEPVYGAINLVDLGLFFTEYYVHKAFNQGQLRCCPINSRERVFLKEDILDYWKSYRVPEKQKPTVEMTVKLTEEESNFVSEMIQTGRKLHSKFTSSDLIRNMLKDLKNLRSGSYSLSSTMPMYFTKN